MVSLGIDIGGTGCKCVAFNSEGDQLALSYREYPLAAGTVNLPSGILWDSTREVIAECVRELADPSEVCAITASSFGESFVAIDKDGNPLTDILLYFGNTQSEEFDKVVETIGPERFMEIARIKPDASYSLSKMFYTKKVADRPVWKFLFIAGFIAWKLSGKPVSDVSLACRSLLYDVANECWSKELLSKTGISEDELPEVLPTGTQIGDILPCLAEEFGLSENVKIVIGAHDQIVNALGAGVAGTGDAVDTTGTCECLTPLFPSIPEGLDFQRNNFACVPYLCGTGYVTYAYNISAGSVVRWHRDVLAGEQRLQAEKRGCSAYRIMNEECPDTPTSLIVLPFFQGMGGTPEVDPTATGAIIGLTTSTRLPEIHRAIMEGITYEMRYNIEKLGISIDRLFVCGGGAQTPAWRNIKADILGRDVTVVKTVETGAMGSAILGFAAITGENPLDMAKRFVSYGETIAPNPENRQFYSKQYEKYKALRAIIK